MADGGIIEFMIEDLISGGKDVEFTGTLTQSISEYGGGTTWTMVNDLMKTAAFPIGAALLSIFMLMEIVGIVQRMENAGSGMMGINIPATVIIRWVIITFLFCKLNVVLVGIQSVMSTLAGKIEIPEPPEDVITAIDIMSAVSDMDMLSQVVCYIILMNIWFLYAALRILLTAFVVYRYFSLYIMTIFAPIPLATLPNQEFKQSAFNYLKSYAAACMSGAVILAAFAVYNALVLGMLNEKIAEALATTGTLTAGDFCSAMLKMMIFFGILVSVVLNSGKLSKSILNAA